MADILEKIAARKDRAFEKNEEELKLKTILEDLFLEAEHLQGTIFPTEESAQEACDSFTQHSMQRLLEIEDAGAIQLRLGGEGVYIPNISVSNDTVPDTAALAVIVDKDSPFGMLPVFEDIEAYIEGFTGSIGKDDNPGSSGYRVHFSMFFRVDDVETASIRLNDSTLKLVELAIIRRGFANLTNETEVNVSALENHREKWELIEDLAKHGMINSAFRFHINKLAQAFHSVQKGKYVEMKNVQLIHRVGELGELFARQSPQKADVVIRATLEAIGKVKELDLIYTKPLDNERLEISGVVQDLLMPTSEEDEQAPTLIVGSNDPIDGSSQTHYVELARIHAVSF